VERVSKEAVEELDSKEVILIFPSQRKNNKTVRVLKTHCQVPPLPHPVPSLYQ